MKAITFPSALLVALALAPVARADGAPSEDARTAYDRGTAAHARGDYRAAASELAQADALAPNPVALKAALDEALLADDPELGMQLVERARTRAPGDATLAPSVHDAEVRFAGRTGRVRIDCGHCTATVDGRPVAVGAAAFVLVGPHHVVLDAGGVPTARDVVVAGDREVDVVLPAAPAPPAPLAPPPPASRRHESAAPSHGLSPTAWFLTSAALTVIAGAATIVSGVDTANQHSSFVARGCGASDASDCGALASSGSGAQTRTNVLAAVTGAFGVTTVVLAFYVPWGSSPAQRAALVVGDRSAALRFRF